MGFLSQSEFRGTLVSQETFNGFNRSLPNIKFNGVLGTGLRLGEACKDHEPP